MRTVGGWAHLTALARIVRRIVGAPDYEAYAAHMRQCRPGEPLLSPDAFARERLEARYRTPGSRCC